MLLSACGGREAHPVAYRQPGDDRISCSEILAEIDANKATIAELKPRADTTTKNIALGVVGALVVFPLFWMDFKDGEGKEIEALVRRNQWLHEIAAGNGCPATGMGQFVMNNAGQPDR